MRARDGVALATWQGMPRSCPDDAHLLEAFEAAGGRAATIPWDDGKADWAGFDAVVVRATWDYYLRHGEFLAWLDRLEAAGARVWNPVPTLRWNSDKRYLAELARRGAPVVPTRFVERGVHGKLARVLDEEGWDEAVVKPAVSAGAYCTFRARRDEAPQAQAAFEELVARDAVLVQPYLPEVQQGEWSFVFLGGAFSHAAVKRPGKGDFRVNEKHGGSLAAGKPTEGQVAQARAVLDSAPAPLLYARVDGVFRGGRFALMELEALEPELFFRTAPGSAGRFVAALQRLQG